MKKILSKIKYNGLWLPIPLTLFVGYILILQFNVELTEPQMIVLMLACHLPTLLIWSYNTIAISNGYTMDQLPLIPNPKDAMYQPSSRMTHLLRKPAKELLLDAPTGLLFGRYEGKYIGVEPCKIGATHMLITAQSGAGKTVTILGSLLAIAGGYIKDTSVICVDVKGELEEKGFRKNGKLRVFNPKNRNKCGFDFFYELNDSSSEETILSTLRRIVYALIPMKADVKDPFWVNAPREVLIGIFLYAWTKRGIKNLPDLADFASSKNLKVLINEIIADSNEYDNSYKMLISFGGKDAADETLSSISMNIANALGLLKTDESLRFLLRECPDKISPLDVEQGYSIDIQVNDYELDSYACILNLCLTTCCHALAKRGENPKQKVVMLIDEMGRIVNSSGVISGVQELLQIGRSRGVSVALITQNFEALSSAYTKGAMADMLTNLPYRLILQAQPDDKESVEMCVKAFGKYSQKKTSYSTGWNQSISYSYEEKDVLVPNDLLTLPDKNKAVLLSPYGAFYISKVRYYRNPTLKAISKEIAGTE